MARPARRCRRSPDQERPNGHEPARLGGLLLGLTSYGTPECGKQYAPAVYTYLQGTGIRSFLDAGTDSATFTAGTSSRFREAPPTAPSGSSPTPAPAPTSSTPATPVDRTKPTASVSRVRCRHRRCTIRFRASDRGGGEVKKLSVKLRRRVRTCRAVDARIRCRTRTRTQRPRAHRIAGGFRVTVRLRPGRYFIAAVATDTSGNRSSTARRRFRVRRR